MNKKKYVYFIGMIFEVLLTCLAIIKYVQEINKSNGELLLIILCILCCLFSCSFWLDELK